MTYPYTEIGNARLYLGDCAEVMASWPECLHIDALLTDPPYGINADKAGAHSCIRDNPEWGDLGWDNKRPPRAIFDAIRERTGAQIIWGGNYFADFLPPSMRWLVWDKGVRGFSLADCEFAWVSQWNAARIYTLPRATASAAAPRDHPTQKPVELMKWCLGFLPDAKAVFDPFMGSGSTGVAAIQLGKRFVGIEREPRYFEIACRRIREATGEDAGPLFGEAAA